MEDMELSSVIQLGSKIFDNLETRFSKALINSAKRLQFEVFNVLLLLEEKGCSGDSRRHTRVHSESVLALRSDNFSRVPPMRH